MWTHACFVLPCQMAEPTCWQRFDFEYERVFGTGNIPKAELQKIMFGDMQHFAIIREDPAADVAERLSRSLWLADEDDKRKDDASPDRK